MTIIILKGVHTLTVRFTSQQIGMVVIPTVLLGFGKQTELQRTEIFKDCDEDNDSNNFFPSTDLDLYNIVGDTFFFTANHYSEVADEVISVLWRTDGVSGGSNLSSSYVTFERVL